MVKKWLISVFICFIIEKINAQQPGFSNIFNLVSMSNATFPKSPFSALAQKSQLNPKSKLTIDSNFSEGPNLPKVEIKTKSVKLSEKKENLTTDPLPHLVNEQQVKLMIQMTYKKLSEDFRKLENLMKKQEEVEKKVKEEMLDNIEGINNIITIENVHSTAGNYTRVTLTKRRVNEVKHSMHFPTGKNSSKPFNMSKQ